MFKGNFVATVTPFRNGSVDEKALGDLIERLIADGVQGFVPCGTTGESATLSHEEHARVISLTIETVRRRVPVLAGTGSNSTAEAIRLTRHAKEAGADGALMITPYYNKPTQEGIFRHFEAVAKAVDLPIVVYNIQGRTAVNIEPATMARLAQVKGIVGVKEASGNLGQVSEIIERCGPGFDVLSGDDNLTLPIIAVGGCGVISASSNVLPGEMTAISDAALAGDLARAREVHYRIGPLLRALFIETNPTPVKTALALMGRIPSDEVRLPLAPMLAANRDKLVEALRAAGLP
ncbi:MAG: 4-hydroxy-tetrahydrodipicolinate synthase [Deltaproteobacteria bacterium]|nr:4-hydroxy-tetrahydrodipicolinate synthase [Deltaproteobacteria bacterium]